MSGSLQNVKKLFSIHRISLHFIPSYYSYILTEQSCPACVELRKRLELEKANIIKFNINNKFKFKEPETKNKRARGKPKQQIVYGKYKPPQVEKMQVRKSLSNLFLGFFKELGFKEEEFPKQSEDFKKVAVVSESDFPIIIKEEEVIPGLPPALPESIPILENIDFDENGKFIYF
jgi:hypothetical protein